MKPKQNDFKFLKKEVKKRLAYPIKTLGFWTEFVAIVIAVGALGVWFSIGLFNPNDSANLDGIGASIFTYFPSVIAPALFQMFYFTKEGSERASAFILAIIALGVFGLSVFSSGVPRILWALLGVGLSLFTWWMANALKDYDVSQNPERDSGAGPAPTTAPAGTGRGFKGIRSSAPSDEPT